MYSECRLLAGSLSDCVKYEVRDRWEDWRNFHEIYIVVCQQNRSDYVPVSQFVIAFFSFAVACWWISVFSSPQNPDLLLFSVQIYALDSGANVLCAPDVYGFNTFHQSTKDQRSRVRIRRKVVQSYEAYSVVSSFSVRAGCDIFPNNNFPI